MKRLGRGSRSRRRSQGPAGCTGAGLHPLGWQAPPFSRWHNFSPDSPLILAKEDAHVAWSNYKLSSAVCGLSLAPSQGPGSFPCDAQPSPQASWSYGLPPDPPCCKVSGSAPSPCPTPRVLQLETTLRCRSRHRHYTAPAP